MIILITLLFLLFIGIIIVSVYLVKSIPTQKKVFEIFEYDYNKLCKGNFYAGDINAHDPTCIKNSFYGNQVCLLDWVSNKNKQDFVCFYYLLQTSLKGNDGLIYTNNNFWITVYSKKNKDTAGSARWSNTYLSRGNTSGKADVPFAHSIMTATSGNLNHIQGAEILSDYRKDIRRIYMYSAGSYQNKDYENYKKELKAK